MSETDGQLFVVRQFFIVAKREPAQVLLKPVKRFPSESIETNRHFGQRRLVVFIIKRLFLVDHLQQGNNIDYNLYYCYYFCYSHNYHPIHGKNRQQIVAVQLSLFILYFVNILHFSLFLHLFVKGHSHEQI